MGGAGGASPVAVHRRWSFPAGWAAHGRADKAQVTAMVTRILRLDAPPKPADAADALALAITHIWRGGAQQRIADAQDRYAEAIATAQQKQAAAAAAARAKVGVR